jgi:hypothetical protein
MRTGHKQGEMQLTCFSEIGTDPEREQLACIQRSRKAGFSCYNVTPLPKSCCSTLFTTVYKRPLKEEEGLFAFGFYFGLLALALAWVFHYGFWLWAFWCGKLLKETRITEGKRIAKRKLLKGKEWLKRG